MTSTVDGYGMPREQVQHVSFMSCKDRETYPKMANDRLGNQIYNKTAAPNRGPGCYDNEDKTNLAYLLERQVASNRGYALGSRTAKRFPSQKWTLTPAPCDHQKNTTRPRMFTPAYEPFLVKCDRFPLKSNDLKVIPGAGTYEFDVKRDKHVEWHQSFGSKPINLPQIEVQSTIKSNTKKLYGTNEENTYQRKKAYFKLFF